MRICHFTSAHKTNDDRIFLKECQSLCQAGYEVFLVGKGESSIQAGVHIVGVGEMPKSRHKRMTKGSRRVYQAALKLDCDIYHFHDPELLPYGLKLKRKGKTVIFDSHEDVPAQIMDKAWLPRFLRKPISRLYKAYETYVVRQLDVVVTATPYIAKQFEGRTKRVAVINNFPRLDDIVFHDSPFEAREPIICYAGGISEVRGERIMIEAMKNVNGILALAGNHEKSEIKNASRSVIRYLGLLDRQGVNDLYGSAVAGLCVLKPIKNYYYSQPIKIYEYMAAGIPFICSDFPVWRKVAEESGAGICVSDNDIDCLTSAIQWLLENREQAQAMGRMGHDYVVKNCLWSIEEKKILSLYRELSLQHQ